jgi:hypothetical protein
MLGSPAVVDILVASVGVAAFRRQRFSLDIPACRPPTRPAQGLNIPMMS